MDYLQRLDKITQRVQALVSKNDQLQGYLTKTDAENDQLKAQVKERNSKIEELESQLRILKLAKQVSTGGTVADEEGKAELKKKINEFIKEIDKCVALLNN